MFTKFFEEDGYSVLTTAGIVACIVLAVIAVITLLFISKKKTNGKKSISAKQLVFSSAALALAFVLSYLQPYKLPWGGAVTFFSMLFICIVGYWYGLRAGLTVAFAYSILQFLQSGGSYILSPLQVCFDYFFAFTALGFSGLFHNKKNGLIKGYLLGIFLRGLFNTIGGYIYWTAYMPDNFPEALVPFYSIIYNYSYIVIEGAATVLVLCIPAVKKALARVKQSISE